MNRLEYLNDHFVARFVKWLRDLVGHGDGSLIHSYRLNQCRPWSCTSLWDAYCKYTWNGTNFEQNQLILNNLRLELSNATENDDRLGFIRTACRVLEWGGVTNKNVQRLCSLGDNALPILLRATTQLNPTTANTRELSRVCYMNSGWTKIYSLMLNDFPMYDSRVSAAMGYLVRVYCVYQHFESVPKFLCFRRSPGKNNTRNRDPSFCTLKFPPFETPWKQDPSRARRRVRKWAECNLWTAWVLGEVKNEGRFGDLPPERRLCALEAALFMIGYELPRWRRTNDR